jgi:hypothetical protein
MRRRRKLIDGRCPVRLTDPEHGRRDVRVVRESGSCRVSRAKPSPWRYIHPLVRNTVPARKFPELQVVHRPPSHTFVVGNEYSERGGRQTWRLAIRTGSWRHPLSETPAPTSPAFESRTTSVSEIVSVNIDGVKRLRVPCQSFETVRAFGPPARSRLGRWRRWYRPAGPQ